MIEKKRVLQPLNLIIYLIITLAVGIIVCRPLFEESNVLLQLAWTGYLLAGMVFLFFVGEKAAKTKIIEKYLINSKMGRFLSSSFWFLICIGCGGIFRIWEMADGAGIPGKNTIYNFFYYLITGLLIYLTARLISGFRSSAAAVILMTLCPFFDFSTKLSGKEYAYTLLILIAVLSILLASYFVEKKSVSLQDTLLTVLSAVSLAGATFIHISAVILMIPCIFLLVRKNSSADKEKKEQRGLRILLFEIFYVCFLVVFFLIYNMNSRHMKTAEIPIDHNLLHIFMKIGKEPIGVLETLFDKFSRVFIIYNQGEYYNGLLLGMLILGIAGAVLLFRKKTEQRFFPVYLFNWYFFFCILLKEFHFSGIVLYILLVYIVSGSMADLSELIFAGKKQKRREPGAEEKQEELAEEEPEKQEELPTEEPKTIMAEKEPEMKQKLETETAGEAELSGTGITENAKEAVPEEMVTEETVHEETVLPDQSLEQQVQELLRREDRVLEIIEKQGAQIARLEGELREQRIRMKKMEHHYRKELAIARNKKR